jgi:hypothetical protein
LRSSPAATAPAAGDSGRGALAPTGPARPARARAALARLGAAAWTAAQRHATAGTETRSRSIMTRKQIEIKLNLAKRVRLSAQAHIAELQGSKRLRERRSASHEAEAFNLSAGDARVGSTRCMACHSRSPPPLCRIKIHGARYDGTKPSRSRRFIAGEHGRESHPNGGAGDARLLSAATGPCRLNASVCSTPPLRVLCEMTQGLVYVHSLAIERRDLACRDCLLDERDSALLSELGYAPASRRWARSLAARARSSQTATSGVCVLARARGRRCRDASQVGELRQCRSSAKSSRRAAQ